MITLYGEYRIEAHHSNPDEYILTKNGANAMPVAASGLTKDDAYMAANVLMAAGPDDPGAVRFWGMWRAIRGMGDSRMPKETAVDDELEIMVGKYQEAVVLDNEVGRFLMGCSADQFQEFKRRTR